MPKKITPHTLLDFLIRECELKNDAGLARALALTAPTVSRMRSRKANVTAETILLIHKKTGLSVDSIETMISESEEEK
jgi:plasmid maintenance system antidote protein VapI